MFGASDFQLKNNIILCSNQAKSPILTGYMLRMFFWFSREPGNQTPIAPGGKYDIMRSHITGSSITGTVYGLNNAINACEIKSGATFNGKTDPNAPGSGITLARDNTTVLNIADFIPGWE